MAQSSWQSCPAEGPGQGVVVSYRLIAVVIVGLLFALAQVRPDVDAMGRPSTTVGASIVRWVPSISVVRADNDNDDDDDNNDDDGSGDNGDGDNGDGGGDNGGGGGDNGDDDDDDADNGNDNDGDDDSGNGNDNRNEVDGGDDNSNGNDNQDASANRADDDGDNDDRAPGTIVVIPPAVPPPGPPRQIAPTPIPPPVMRPDNELTDGDEHLREATFTSDGGIGEARIRGGRVLVRYLPTLVEGITVTLRLLDPNEVSPLPPGLAGRLVFVVQAYGPNGAPLATLPAEVNLNVRYDDEDVAGLNEAVLVLSHLDGASKVWQQAPKLLRDPGTNFLAASVTALGAYAVHAP